MKKQKVIKKLLGTVAIVSLLGSSAFAETGGPLGDESLSEINSSGENQHSQALGIEKDATLFFNTNEMEEFAIGS